MGSHLLICHIYCKQCIKNCKSSESFKNMKNSCLLIGVVILFMCKMFVVLYSWSNKNAVNYICYCWNISRCGNFCAKWHRHENKNAQIILVILHVNNSGRSECAIGRPTVPHVYTLLRTLYVKLTERMQRFLDRGSIVHVCTRVTAENIQNCSNSVEREIFPLLQ